MNFIRRSIFLAFLLISFFYAYCAFAHRVNLYVTFDGDKIKGNAYFSNGKPAQYAPIFIKLKGNNYSRQIRTDKNGKFEFVPKTIGTYQITLKAADGHLAKAIITVTPPKELENNVPLDYKVNDKVIANKEDLSGCSLTLKEIDAFLAKRIEPLEQEIQKLVMAESRISFHDIISGLGYILGIMGIWLYFSSRNKN